MSRLAQPSCSTSQNCSTQVSRLAQEVTLEDSFHEQARYPACNHLIQLYKYAQHKRCAKHTREFWLTNQLVKHIKRKGNICFHNNEENQEVEESKEASARKIHFRSSDRSFQFISLPFPSLSSHFYICKSLMTMRG